MKLVRNLHLTEHTLKFAYPAEHALTLVKQALQSRTKIKGLKELRTRLTTRLDTEVLRQIKDGRWLLINRDEENFTWAVYEAAVNAKRRAHRAQALLDNPPPQPKRKCLVFCIVDSASTEPLADRTCIAAFDGQRERQKIDRLGIAYLVDQTRNLKLSVHVLPSA